MGQDTVVAFDYDKYNRSAGIQVFCPAKNLELKIQARIWEQNKYESLVCGRAALLRVAKDGRNLSFCQDAVGAIFDRNGFISDISICDGVSGTVAGAQAASVVVKLFMEYAKVCPNWFYDRNDCFSKLHANFVNAFNKAQLIQKIESDQVMQDMEKQSMLGNIYQGGAAGTTLIATKLDRDKIHTVFYGDGSMILINDEEVHYFDRNQFNGIGKYPPQFNVSYQFDEKLLWHKTVQLLPRKKNLIIIASDGLDASFNTLEIINDIKHNLKDASPEGLVNSFLGQYEYEDDLAVAYMEITP